MDIEIEDVVRDMFARRVSSGSEWYRSSRALFAAARASQERYKKTVDILDRMDMDRVVSMLYGFGLECLFKALIVMKDFGDPHAEGWDPKPEHPKKLATHDLKKLAEMVDASLVSRYEWELSYFTEAAVWLGRYPSSKRGDEGSIVIDPRCFAKAEEIYSQYAVNFSISG